MRSKREIKQKMTKIADKMVDYQKQYSGLNQIDLLSGEGNELKEEINKIKGALFAFKWVLEK
jgi:hypothetical protein